MKESPLYQIDKSLAKIEIDFVIHPAGGEIVLRFRKVLSANLMIHTYSLEYVIK